MSVSLITKIKNDKGIHARPSSIIAKEALKFKSDIKLIYDNKTADAKDVLQIIMLELFQGVEIRIEASGEDEEKALKTIKELMESKFQFD